MSTFSYRKEFFRKSKPFSLSLSHVFSYVCILLLLCVLLFCRNIINMKNSPAQKNLCRYLCFAGKNSLLPFFIMYMCKNRFYSTLKNALKNKNTMYKLCTGGTCEREREVGKKEVVKKSKSMFL